VALAQIILFFEMLKFSEIGFFSKENKNFVKENEASFAIILIYFIFKMESSKLINYSTNMCPYDGAP
jgi:hypothetical protein